MRRTLLAASWVMACTGPVLGALHVSGLAADGARTPVPGVAGWTGLAMLACASLLSIWVHPKARFAVLAATTTVATVVTAAVLDADSSVDARVPEFLYCAALALLALGLVVLLRRRLGPGSGEVLVDGVMVGLGAWIVMWVVLINPALVDPVTGDSTGGLLTVARAATLAATILVLFLVTTNLFSHDTTTASVSFLGISSVLVLAAVVTRAILTRTADLAEHREWVDAALVASIPTAGAALLHPSVEQNTATARARRTSPLMARLVTTTASLIAPIIVLALTDPTGARDRAVRAASVSILAVAAMARIVQAARANARAQGNLLRTALTDSLTGLPNRTLMLEHIADALADSHRTRRQPTVLFIDVDRFKAINDSMGHAAGDTVLEQVARRLVAAAGPSATVARISGDEFVVLDASTESPTQSVLVAERILEAFGDPVMTRSGDMFVTASIGVAYAARNVDLDAEDLMRHADAAMYRAKDAGRNCIALFDEAMLDRVSARLDIETALYRALERDELRLVHQPIVDVDLGLVVGFEALMRWDRPDSGAVSPAEFIPIAEETGTIVPLGSWALRDALVQLRMWMDAGTCAASTTMSVNVSPRQLLDPHFVATVADALAVAGLRPEQLWVEVTEGAMITEPDQTIATLRRLHALGVRIAIDDFGTGYSSLSILQQFPVQCIKIDRSFVQAMVDNEGTRSIVRTIVAMARSLGADIVAEGVEHPDQIAALRDLRCSRVQGYLLGRPVPADQIPAVIAAIHDPDRIGELRGSPTSVAPPD